MSSSNLKDVWNAEFEGMKWAWYAAKITRKAFGNIHKLPKNKEKRVVRIWSDDRSARATLILYPKPQGKHKLHRVFVMCYKCGNQVLAGRIMQHKCKV